MLNVAAPYSPTSRKVRQRLFLAFVVLVVVVGFTFIEYQQTVRCQVVLHPQRRWRLSEENPGVLLSRSEDLITGQTSHYQLFQFDRPAFLELEFPILVEGDGTEIICAVGDVMARAHSSSLVLDEARQQRALSEARAHLDALKVGAKEATIAEAKLAVKRAEADLAIFEVHFARQKKLRQEKLISDADLEDLEGRRSLMVMDVALAQAQLEVHESGADSGRIAEAEALIPELQNELDITRKMIAAQTIRAPMAGRVGTGGGNGSVLLEVTPTDSMAVKLYMPVGQAAKILGGNPFILHLAGRDFGQPIKGNLVGIDAAVRGGSTNAYLAGMGVVPNPGGILESGMRGTAYVDCGKIKIWKFVYKSVVQTMRREFPTT